MKPKGHAAEGHSVDENIRQCLSFLCPFATSLVVLSLFFLATSTAFVNGHEQIMSYLFSAFRDSPAALPGEGSPRRPRGARVLGGGGVHTPGARGAGPGPAASTGGGGGSQAACDLGFPRSRRVLFDIIS